MTEKKMNENLSYWFNENEQQVRDLMHEVWSHPQLGLQEAYAAKACALFAEKNGFTNVKLHKVEDFDNSNAEPNSVIAKWGSGHPVIAFVGELDALPNLGQDCTVAYKKPIEGAGHGCGHNLMAGGAAGAAAALRYAMEKENLKGTVVLVEAPAEEIGVGKAWLAKNGVFKDMDMIYMWHQGEGKLSFNARKSYSVVDATFEFNGKTAHAAGVPWNGRSALDAVMIMNIGCEFLREHMPTDCRMHYCIENGGSAPNIVPGYSSVHYMFRSTEGATGASDLYKRALKCAEGAAHMTETELNVIINSEMPHHYYNSTMSKLVYEAAEQVEPLTYTDEEYKYAREMYKNVFDKDAPQKDSDVLNTELYPYMEEEPLVSCTDASDMSYFCPSVYCRGLGRLPKSSGHTWAVTACAGNSIGEKASFYAFKVLAQAAYNALISPKAIEDCWKCFKEQDVPEYTVRV